MIYKLIQKLYTAFMNKPCIFVLKKLGLSVGDNFSVQYNAYIDISHCFLISMGNNVTLAPSSIVLAHDASTKNNIGYTKIGNVTIGDNVFVGAGAIILPNVEVGSNVIIGAGAVVTKNIPSNCVALGAPADKVCSLDDYLCKFKSVDKGIVYDENYKISKISKVNKERMKKKLKSKIGLIK